MRHAGIHILKISLIVDIALIILGIITFILSSIIVVGI